MNFFIRSEVNPLTYEMNMDQILAMTIRVSGFALYLSFLKIYSFLWNSENLPIR